VTTAAVKQVLLRNITTLITKGTTPTTIGYEFTNSGVNFIKAEAVTLDGQINESVFVHIDDATHRRLKRSQIEAGDILFSIAGMKLGKSAVVKARHVPANTNQALAIIRADRSAALPEFLHYHFLNPEHYRYVNAITAQAAQPNINLAQVGDLPILLPPLPVQRRIAGILSAYDDLIENGQRRIRILEALARSLYREWFVHFRFPGHEKLPRVASQLGEIPQGWEGKTLGQIAENFDRLRKPLSSMQRAEIQGVYPYYGAAKVFDYISNFIFDGEYLLMAEDGSVIAPDRSPVLQLVNEQFWPNNHTHVLRGKPPFSTHFLYLGLSNVDISPYITGAAQPKITQENMNRIPFFCGPKKLQQEFDRLVAPMIRGIQILQRQIQNLRRTRDLLLPRLLTGRIEFDRNQHK
jgi:type I restriction enzyme S subunit